MVTAMDDEPPRVRLVLSDNFSAGMARVAAAQPRWQRRMSIPEHSLDRVDPNLHGPQVWTGDGA